MPDWLTSQGRFVTLVTGGRLFPWSASPPAPADPALGATMTTTTSGTVVLTGTPVVPGVALGPVVRPSGAVRLPSEDLSPVPGERRAMEKARFAAAAEKVAERLARRAGAATGGSAEGLSATAGLARDRGLLSAVEQRIDSGVVAEVATLQAAQQFVDLFTSLGGLMAERATDVRDVRNRIVAELTGQGEPGVPTPDEPSILLADDLAPADTAGLDPERIVGLATRLGGTTSHTAIIARQLGLPCVVAVGGLDDVPAGAVVLLDGEQGTVTVDPDPDEAGARVAAARIAAEALAGYEGPATTRDGHAVQVLANVQDGAGARTAVAAHAEGVGLLRTELAFLGHAEDPSVEEQAKGYAAVFEAFAGRKVVLRTLDAGSDKPLAFATLPDEANPALGVRGLRISRRDPGLLERQLDAVAPAAPATGSTPRGLAPLGGAGAEGGGIAAG